MKFKKNNWLNLNDDNGSSVKFGIDVVKDGETMHVSQGDKPLFFETEEDRDKKIIELNQNK